MKIVHNRFIPPRRFLAVNLFGVLFCRRGAVLSEDVLRHEKIHTAQMREMLFVGFYLWYVAEWTVRLFMRGNAYSNISMEREAYENMFDPSYLKRRERWAWRKYIKAPLPPGGGGATHEK